MASKVIFKFGTKEQFDAQNTKLDNALYFLTDTGELYRGNIPFGQARLYTGLLHINDNLENAIATAIGNNTPVVNDIIIFTLDAGDKEVYIYDDTYNWQQIGYIPIASTTDIITRVSNLETTLHGSENPPTPGIIADLTAVDGRLTILEDMVGQPSVQGDESSGVEPQESTGIYNLIENISAPPIFDGLHAGLVPNLDSTIPVSQLNKYILLGDGTWARDKVGELVYNNITYNNVTDYITAVIEGESIEWHPINE